MIYSFVRYKANRATCGLAAWATRFAKTAIALTVLAVPLDSKITLAQTTPVPKTYVGLARGEELEICQRYLQEIRKTQAPFRYCGVAIPRNDLEFSLYEWQDLDASQHLELVREIFYWSNADTHQLGKERFQDGQLSRARTEIDGELLDIIWSPVRSDVEAMVRRGEIKLQRTLADADGNGTLETVYRMTPVERPYRFNRPPPGVSYLPVGVKQADCQRTDLPEAEANFVYYVRPEESLDAYLLLRSRKLSPGMHMFKWRGHVFWLSLWQVQEPRTVPGLVHVFNARSICIFSAVTPN